jgi:hypothetical protein
MEDYGTCKMLFRFETREKEGGKSRKMWKLQQITVLLHENMKTR